MIGLVTTYFQQYITSFIRNSRLLAKHYEPPSSLSQVKNWFNAVTNLEAFSKSLKDVRHLTFYGGFLDIGLKLAIFRQFNSGWQSNFGGFDYNLYRKMPTTFAAAVAAAPFGVIGDMALRAYHADKSFPP